MRLLPGSNPVPMTVESASIEMAEKYKRYECRRYANCLDHAYAAGWTWFACNNCKVRERLTREERRQDFDALADLLRIIRDPRELSMEERQRDANRDRMRAHYWFIKKTVAGEA